MWPLFAAFVTFLGVSLKAKAAQAETTQPQYVDYGEQFGPVYQPQQNFGRHISLDQLKQVVATAGSGQFAAETMLSIAKVESGAITDPNATFDTQAYRYEPALGTASYGVFQILATTAKDMGLSGNANQMYDPYVSCKIAVAYLTWIQNYLNTKLGRIATLREVLYAYNGGVGNFLRHRNGTVATRQYVDRYNTALETVQSA